MNDYKSVDNLVSDIVGTTNFIGRILFNRNSVILAAAISLLLIVVVWVL
jgi:hypothetical protein